MSSNEARLEALKSQSRRLLKLAETSNGRTAEVYLAQCRQSQYEALRLNLKILQEKQDPSA